MAEVSLEQIYEQIVKEPIKIGSSGDNEIIDILHDYPWSKNTFSKSPIAINDISISSIPCCILRERKQVVSSSISNIINSIMTLAKLKERGKEIVKDLQDSKYESLKSLSNLLVGAFKSAESNFEDKTEQGLIESITKNDVFTSLEKYSVSVNDKLLEPYSYLYFTKSTSKSFCFPMVNDAASSFDVTNTFGSETNVSGLMSNALTNIISSGAESIVRGLNDIQNILAAINSTGAATTLSFIEKAKMYNVPAEKSVTVSFPLFNTTVRDAWKKNFKFIYHFTLRNMMFKTDMGSYKQPLLYDLLIPGSARMPLCYVSSISIKPQGIIRTLTIDNLISSDLARDIGAASSGISVHVPEAWTVSITFNSLLADSANQFLSSLSTINVTSRA